MSYWLHGCQVIQITERLSLEQFLAQPLPSVRLVVFQASSTAYIALTFDSTNNKIVIAYTDYGNSDYPKVIVGYWDGAQLSFGTAVVLYSNTGYYLANTYDSSTGRVFVAFSSAAQSYAGRGGAGTVSGTSITFAAGTEAVGTNLSLLISYL